MWSPSFRSAGRSHGRRPRPARTGALRQGTAAVTLAVLKALSLRRSPFVIPGRAGRGLALLSLGGATLRLLRSRLDSRERRRKRWARRARRALREPVEKVLAAAMLGALALPLMVEPPAARSVHDGGGDGGDLDLEGPIASW